MSQNLVIADSNQLLERPGKLYNVDTWSADMQMSSPVWDSDKLMTVTILKLYNQVTCQFSLLKGEDNVVAGTPGIITSVAGTLPGAHPTGKIPARFLPMNNQVDIDDGTDDAYFKAYSAQGIHNGTGFTHMLTITHYPIGNPNAGQNGQIKISYNNSTQDFTHKDAGIDSGNSFTWLNETNMNIAY